MCIYWICKLGLKHRNSKSTCISANTNPRFFLILVFSSLVFHSCTFSPIVSPHKKNLLVQVTCVWGSPRHRDSILPGAEGLLHMDVTTVGEEKPMGMRIHEFSLRIDLHPQTQDSCVATKKGVFFVSGFLTDPKHVINLFKKTPPRKGCNQ